MPGSSPVTRSPRPAWVPVTTLPMMVSDTPNLGASGRGAVPQNARYCSSPMYSSPVTWRQLPGSLPVTRSLRPSSVPVTWPPRTLEVTPPLSGDAFAPDGRCGEFLEVPVVARPAPASIPVIREGRSMLLPLTWRPLPVRVVVTLAGAGCGAVPQNSLTWPAGRYSLPVTRVQMPASLPVTLVLRPTSVPVT